MANWGIRVKVTDDTSKISRKMAKNLQQAVTDVTLDIKRVSSASAPHKTGRLEKNTHSVQVEGKAIVGTVKFNAVNKGFNYAVWTHNATYNLGERSKAKSGGKSKYGSGSVPVGKGYLKNTVDNGRSGYREHLKTAFEEAIK